MNISHFLQSFGLTETEIRVYLHTMTRERWSAQDLSRETGLKRPTVYYALEALEKKGLVYFVGHKRTGYFRAESPKQLASILNREKSRITDLEQNLIKALPFFPNSSGVTDISSEVTYYRGLEGLKNLLEKSFQSKSKTLYSIMPSFRVVEKNVDESYMRHYLEERSKYGIVTKSIWQDLPSNKEFMVHKKFLRSVRLAPKNFCGQSNAMIDIFDNKVVTTMPLPEVFGFMVTSTDYSEMMRALWKTLWDVSRPLK